MFMRHFLFESTYQLSLSFFFIFPWECIIRKVQENENGVELNEAHHRVADGDMLVFWAET
jgi:hypothetical protein